VIWILIAVLVVLSVGLLAVVLLGLWRRLKVLTRTVGAMGALVESGSASLELRPRGAPPAPAAERSPSRHR
jgi:hypothetical protein